MPSTSRRAWKSRGILLVALSWALTAIVGVAIAGAFSRSDDAATPKSGGAPAVPNLVEPLVYEETTTVSGAQTALGVPMAMPVAAAASNSNLTHVWMNGEHQVALVYDSGKLTIMMWPARYTDPLEEFESFISVTTATASITQVAGRPTLVIEPGTDAPRSNPAWVEFDRAGIDVNIVSDSYGTSTLLDVANSMQ